MLGSVPHLIPLFFAIFAWTSLLGIVCERLLHASIFFFASSLVSAGGASASLKRFASMEVMKESFSGIFDSMQGVALSAGTFIFTVLTSWLFIGSVCCVLFLSVSLQHESSEIITSYVRVYNGDLSRRLRTEFLLILQYGESFLQPVILFWNATWYTFKLFQTDVILPLLMGSSEYVQKLVGAIGLLARSLTLSIVSYIQRLAQNDCSIERLMGMDQVRNGTLPCFVPGRRAFDLITPLGDFRLIVMYSLLILRNSCKVLTPPFDIMAYPFLDLNFAKGLHNIVNAFLYWGLHMPIMTVKRCTIVTQGVSEELTSEFEPWMKFLMCTPDATPGFNYLIAGVRRWGQLADNWLNALWMVLLAALGLPTPSCAPIPLTMRAVSEKHLFGGNETRIVGLTSGAYAITDGLSVEYTFFMGRVTMVFAPFVWDSQIDIKHGIAAVMYDHGEEVFDASSGQQTLSMMGCRCLDVPDLLGYSFNADTETTRMEIECSVLQYDPAGVSLDGDARKISAPYYVPVAFSVPAAALYMRCATTKITVDSARFPLWRLGEYLESGRGSSYYDPMDGEFTRPDGVDGPDEVDAVVWVMPACDGDTVSPACQRTLLDSGCFPYCMAARRRGGRNAGLTLYSATDWVNNVQLMEHDCSAQISVESTGLVVEFAANRTNPQTYQYKGMTYSNLDILDGQFVFTQSWDPKTQACTYNPTTTSRVARGTAITSSSDLEMYDAILMEGQPFAFAGETALTIVETVTEVAGVAESQWAIRVQRLYGQQGTGFVSLVEVNGELPATGPCITMRDCPTDASSYSNRYHTIATVPYSVFSDPSKHNPAVMTKWGVIYAANPSYAMYSEFFKMCGHRSSSLQYQLESSWGPIRLWRVNAFAYDDPRQGGVRASKTGGVAEVPDGFQYSTSMDESVCTRVFNVRVSSIEYLNDQNVAVQVLRTSAMNYNPATDEFAELDDNGPKTTYVTYFLNPETMRLKRDEMWEGDNAASELGQGLLCPSQRRMPDFGSMAAEIVSAGLHAMRMISELVLSGPAVFTPGSFSRITSMNVPINFGHSFLLAQGMGWMNFDLFFESLRRAHQHFWNIFIKVGGLFDSSPYMNMFMNGFAMYNQDYTPLVTKNMRTYLGAASRAAKVVDQKISQMVQSIAGKNPIVFTGMAASAGAINMAHYALRMLRTTIVLLLFPAMDASVSGAPATEVIHGLWQVVYDSQENYKTLILASEMRSCVGLQLMLGQSNPFGQLAGSVCQSGVFFKLGVVETTMAFFVDLPMLECLCTKSEGLDFKKWARENCWEAAPTHFKGVVYDIISSSSSLDGMCAKASAHVQTRIRDSMDPFLASSYRASGTLADTVDYLRFVWDETAGACRDFAGDASVTTIIPDPVEFWRICSWTKTCKTKCYGSINVFEKAKESNGVTIRDVHRVNSVKTVESAFFSDMDIIASRSVAPIDILEMSEMRDCVYTCGIQNALLNDRCVAILGLEYGVLDGLDPLSATVVVYEYCVPHRLDAFVWLARSWRVANSHRWTNSMLQIRLLHQGREHCGRMGFDGAFCSVAVVSPSSVSLYRQDGLQYALEPYSATTEKRTRMTMVHRVAALGNDVLLIDGMGPSQDVNSNRVGRSLCVDISIYNNNEWGNYDVLECQQNVLDNSRQELPVCIFDTRGDCTEMLLIPTQDEVAIVRCSFEDVALGILQPRGMCEQFPLSKGAVKKAGLYNMISEPVMGTFSTTIQQRRSTIVVSSSISAVALRSLSTSKSYNVFVANHPKRNTNWLAALLVDTRVRAINFRSSLTVNLDMQIVHGCRLDDCTGCKTRSLQTLCYAAQQCTIANCIGTTINLNKPLCAVGELLADGMEAFLLQWRGGWNLMSLMLVQTIAVSSTGKTSSDSMMTGLDEIFISQICLQKDAIFDIAGTVTSFLNANINMVDDLVQSSGDVGALFNAPRIFDVEDFVSSEYRQAQRTMVLAAVTRFLGNVGIGAVYPLLVARKMMMCQANDLVAIFSVVGLSLTITSPEYEDAYDAMTGKCMTDFESDNIDNGSSSTGVNAVLDGIVAWLGTVPFANYKHLIDAALSYMMGLIRGVQDMVQVSDVKNCKLRNPGVAQQGHCACGDTPVQIPPMRGGEAFETHAFWCTGFLRMETPFGTPLFVYNPYPYTTLLEYAQGTDTYLECLGAEQRGSCTDLEPQPPRLLQMQGAKLLAVITRCHANYQAMQWDAGASRLYDNVETLPPYLHHPDIVRHIKESQATVFMDTSITRCMQRTLESGLSNDGCLQQYMASPIIGLGREDFFVYRDIAQVPTAQVPTEQIAACIVFSGPSTGLNVEVNASRPFRACTEPDTSGGGGGTSCQLQGYLWSSRSRNAVPVANMHSIGFTDKGDREKFATYEYQQVVKDMVAAIERTDGWTGDNLKVSLFTSEGDWLHQAFDCVILGPYGRADLSPRDVDDELPALEYFRDNNRGASRDFVLPCSGSELHGDMQTPFTCGSSVRRSIIKTFVRDSLSQGDNNGDALSDQVKEKVNAIIALARDLFGDISNFGCLCSDTRKGKYRESCCMEQIEGSVSMDSLSTFLRSMTGVKKAQLLESFVPSHIRNFEFTKIQNSGIGGGLLDHAFEYLESDLWTNRSVSTSYDVNANAYKLSSQQKELASQDGLYQTTRPLTSYGHADAFQETTTASAFEVCMGAVSQVMFTLPIVGNSTGIPTNGIPTTLSSMEAWDPTQVSPEGHFTSLEAWVYKLVAHARDVSPLFWSHRIKHVASDSRVCIGLFGDGLLHDSSVVPPTWPSSEEASAAYALLAASVQPGPTRGIYETWVGNSAYNTLRLQPPTGTGEGDAIFRETNSSMWALGQIARTCFCGWDSVQDAEGRVWCMIPPEVCQMRNRVGWSSKVLDICDTQSGMYWNHWDKSDDSRIVGVEMQDHIQLFQRLHCPWNMADASAWGLLDEDSFVNHWLLEQPNETATRFTTKHLLHEGRGGVRYMNAADVLKRGRDSPIRLFNPLEVASTVAQHHCEAHVKTASTSPLHSSYAQHFRDVLFPAVQGVPENRATAFCLRYVTELATFTALRHVLPADSIEVTKQLQIMTKWNRKCHTQTKLLGFCALRNVFSAHRAKPGNVESDRLINHPECKGITFVPGTGLGATESFVVAGSSCVAVYHKSTSNPATSNPIVLIFDPCSVLPNCHHTDTTTTIAPVEINVVEFIAEYGSSHAVLDAYSFLSQRSRTLSLKWSKPDDPHWASIQSSRDLFGTDSENSGLNSDAVGLEIEKLWNTYIRPTQPVNPLSSTLRTPWHRSSGPRHDDVHASCGGVSDWWPVSWEHPVGFHVTTPCADKNVAYRTFSNQFQYDRDAHKMRYRHTIPAGMRSEKLTMNNAGASGVCRLNTFGQTLREQNNVRVCTRMRTGVRVDYAVPVLNNDNSGNEKTWTTEACSTSSHHVPWDIENTQEARMRSSGLLTSWPDNISRVWLSSTSVLHKLGLPADAKPGLWAETEEDVGECGMPPLFECTHDSQCAGDNAVGVEGDKTMKCINNVCMVTAVVNPSSLSWVYDSKFVECTSHRHCSDSIEEGGLNRPDMLCSGEGRCVLPVVEINNEYAGGSVDLSWHATSCDSATMETIDMYGKSAWGRITGLFEAHGLCSYRNWFEYRNVFDTHCDSASQTTDDIQADICNLGTDVHWADTLQEEDDTSLNIFASQKILYQEPHRCDRDFEHYDGHVMCSPKITTAGSVASMYSGSWERGLRGHRVPARYNKLYQTYYRANGVTTSGADTPHHVKVARMENMGNHQTGFLGTDENFHDLNLQACVNIPQCSQPDYRIHGRDIADRLVNRATSPSTSMTDEYRVKDAVSCGAFGYLMHNSFCKVDFAVVPLVYLFLYDFDQLDQHCDLKPIDGAQKAAIRTALMNRYNPTQKETIRGHVNAIVNDIFQTGFNSLPEYNRRITCADHILTKLDQGYFLNDDAANSIDAHRIVYSLPIDTTTVDTTDGNTTTTTTTTTTKSLYSDSTINMFTEYSMVEVAPMWWVKCHLLSELDVSDSNTVECPAWDRWLQTTNANPAHAIPYVTVKEWLQQTAMPTVEIEDMLMQQVINVKYAGYIALDTVHRNLTGGDHKFTDFLKPKCYTRRKWTWAVKRPPAENNEDDAAHMLKYQHMVFETYNSASSTAIKNFAPCGETLAGCVESVDKTVLPPYVQGKTIRSILQRWMFEDYQLGNLVQRVPDAELFQSMVPQWGPADIALFSQPWLHTDTTSAPVIPDSLDSAVEYQFPSNSEDRCLVWGSRDQGFEGTSEEARGACIYKGNTLQDIMTNSYPRVDAQREANIVMHHGTDAMHTTGNTIKVCKPDSAPTATFLGQKCYIGSNDEHTSPRTPVSEGYTCQVNDYGDDTIGCGSANAGNPVTVLNPHPDRVCYEVGNTCFNDDNSDEFARSAEYTWHLANLPPGVRLITYGYPYEAGRIIGRNPKYQGENEKLFWNNTLFDRKDVVNRVKDLVVTGDGHNVFATPIVGSRFTVPSRRLLHSTGPDGPETMTETRETKNREAPASRNLLDAGMYPEWVRHEKCGPGWVWKVDADGVSTADGGKNFVYDCKAVVKGENGDCCQCRDGDYEEKGVWRLDVYLWTVGWKLASYNGCTSCPAGKSRTDVWVDKASDGSYVLPCKSDGDDTGTDPDATTTPVPEFVPSTCLFDNQQWPPLMAWTQTHGGTGQSNNMYTGGVGEDLESCSICDTNPCTYYKTLSTYTRSDTSQQYPPWYNCNIPQETRHADSGPAVFPKSIMDNLKVIQALNRDIDGNIVSYVSTTEAASIFAKNYDSYMSKYFDYNSGPSYLPGNNMNMAGSASDDVDVALVPGYQAFSLELMAGFTCDSQTCDGNDIEIRNGYFYCGDCSRGSPDDAYCRGNHECDVEVQSLNANYYRHSSPQWEKILITFLRQKSQDNAGAGRSKLSLRDTIRYMLHLTMSQYRKTFLANSLKEQAVTERDAFYIQIPRGSFLAEKSVLRHPVGWDFPVYSPDRALLWEQRTGTLKTPAEGPPFLDIGACLDTSAETAKVSYKQCNQNDHLLALRERARKAYTSPGTVEIPRYFSLVLPVSATKLVSADRDGGALLMWAQSERALREKHFEYLMDFANHCENTTIWEAVCRVRADMKTIDVFNPWTGGDFSALEGCDIKENTERTKPARVFDTLCKNPLYCETQDNSSIFYAEQGDGCRVKNDKWAPGRIVSPWMRSNMCFLKPMDVNSVDSGVCKHPQGLLGGGSNSGGAGVPQPNLYAYTARPDTREPGGLFVRPHRKLFRTPEFLATDVGIDKNFLHLHKDDIGGHQMHFVVSEEGVLRLYDIVLAGSSAGDAMSRTQEHNAMRRGTVLTDGSEMHEWLKWDALLEHTNAHEQEPDLLEDSSRPLHWGCPLKQRLYLSGQAGSKFRPSLPNARRAATIFALHSEQTPGGGASEQTPGGGASDDSDTPPRRSNTVQAAGQANVVVHSALIKTSNGFCYCESLEDCQLSLVNNGPCSFSDTVKALRDDVGGWHTSMVMKGTRLSACVEQLDWPYTGGVLRDGSWISSSDTTERTTDCNLLDRIHDFEYRYSKDTPNTNSDTPRNTQVPGGDCYTGPAQTTGSGGATHAWDPSERRSCAQTCSAPPGFTAGTSSSSSGGEDKDIPPETSFGVLYRESAERAIAGNLREMLRESLCASTDETNEINEINDSCEKLDHVLNMSSWVSEEFWQAFVDDEGNLFTVKNMTDADGGATQTMSAGELLRQASEAFETNITPEEVAMWEVPWVFCKRVDPECTTVFDENTKIATKTCSSGSSVGNCTRSISKETWSNPHTRVGACRDALLDTATDTGFEAVAPIDVCDIDSTMNSLCVAIQAARSKIFEINCKAAGVCHEEAFFYVPGIYSASNQEFVQATVENFYLDVHEDACPIADDRSEAIHESNQASVQQCASTQLQIVYDMLGNMRVIVDKIMRISYFYFMVQISLLRFIFMRPPPLPDVVDNTESQTWGQVMKYWELLSREMGALFEALGNLVFEFMMDSGLGKQLQIFLDWICTTVQWLFDDMWIAYICPQILLPLGTAFVEFEIAGWAPFKQMGLDMLDMHKRDCVAGKDLCDGLVVPLSNGGPTSLPVATRCWSTYSTFLGDARSLSCSAADTCTGGDLSALMDDTGFYSQSAGMGVCDSCPDAPSTSFARYGCDIVTKTCKCGVQTLLRTTCIANDECALSGSTCDIVDDFFERDIFGSISCAECATDRICLVAPGDTVGHCGCATRQVSFATCEPQARGELVFTPPFSMCMVALGSAAQGELRSSSTYNIEGSKLATSRCDMLDASQRYCISVERGPGVSETYAVGLENLHSRRLLSFMDSNSSASAFYRFVIPPDVYEQALHGDWSAVHTHVCRHVPRLVNQTLPGADTLSTSNPLSISDEEMLKACVRWRAIGMEIVHVANISHLIPDTFLIGAEDFAYDVVAHPSRLYAVLQRPWLWVRALLHTQSMTPLRVLIRDAHRWWVHANIEAFASTNALVNAMEEMDSDKHNNTDTHGHTANNTPRGSFETFSRGMSRHLTGLFWRHLFSRGTPLVNKHAPHKTAQPPTKVEARERRRKDEHKLALGHAIMHTPTARAHWVPEESTMDTGPIPVATHYETSSTNPETNSETNSETNPETNSETNFEGGSPTNPEGLSPATESVPAGTAGKRALQQFIDNSFINRMNAVQSYSSEVALGEGVVQILPKAAAAEFVKGDIPWPPTYVYWGTDDSCNVATSMLSAIQKVVAIMAKAYSEKDRPVRPDVLYSPVGYFTTSWHHWTRSAEERSALREQERIESAGSAESEHKQTFTEFSDGSAWYVKYPVNFFSWMGFTPDPLLGIAYDLPETAIKLLTCNVESVMFCTRHTYSVFTASFIAIIALTIISALFSFTKIPVVSGLFAMFGFTGIVMFVAFGYSPACIPLVPTCFFSSMVSDVSYFIPLKIIIPQSLLRCTHDQSESVPDASCLVQCNAKPFYFVDFSANLAWTVCYSSMGLCNQLGDYLATPGNLYTATFGLETAENLATAVYRSKTVVGSEDQNIISGFAWCNTLTIYQLIPLVVIIVFVLLGLPLGVSAIMKILVSVTRTAFSAYALSHVD
ncbi:hypothetical protein T484DRAFT_3629701 [Baffinella frigidus]|nr:hypothetical protein T484DRAFT_3629701 [Cryptophyta sp. CCMP2293]